MDQSSWKLNTAGTAATLEADGLHGSIDLNQPTRGFSHLAALGRKLPNWRLFAICVPSLSEPPSPGGVPCSNASPANPMLRLIDSYTRGADLIAAFRIEAVQPFDLTVCWRVVRDATGQGIGLDVIPAVNTELLDSRPEVVLWSQATAQSIWQLCAKGVWQELPATGPESQPVSFGGREQRQSALLWRNPNNDHDATGCSHTATGNRKSAAGSTPGVRTRSEPAAGTPTGEQPDRAESPAYVEMVSPNDWPSMMYRSQNAQHEVWHRLFTMPLEKGVILRTRLRGMFFPTTADALRSGWESYQSLLAEPPPLTV